jgi:hypothetical protein
VVKPTVATAGINYDKYCIYVKETVGDREDIHEIIIYQNTANTQGNTDLDALVA